VSRALVVERNEAKTAGLAGLGEASTAAQSSICAAGSNPARSRRKGTGVAAKVAITHDAFVNMGGAERVVTAFHECFPEAPIYTSVFLGSKTHAVLRDADMRPSWMQAIARSERAAKLLFPLTYGAMGRLDLSAYDVVLSSSTYCAKNVNAAPGAVHVCYCHAPFRPVWEFERYTADMSLPPFCKLFLRLFFAQFRRMDFRAAQKPDHLIANSRYTAGKIERAYRRKPSAIIYPPVDVERYRCDLQAEDYFLVVSRLHAYKRVDIVIEAFNRLQYPLKIVGVGSDMARLRGMAKKNVEFVGSVSEETLRDYYARCRCLVFPGEEDFGLTPVEAHASGKPVIAFARGGALETIMGAGPDDPANRSGQATGVFFDESSPEAIVKAVQSLEQTSFDAAKIRARAERFGKAKFEQDILRFIQEAIDAKSGQVGRPARA
jgi:glycosyltransferase involved in cell wall biosynthesis